MNEEEMHYRIIYIIIFFTISVLFFSCNPVKVTEEEKQQIFNEKGFNEMKKERLKPELYKHKYNIIDIVDINIPNTMAGLNGKGEFIFIRFDDEGEISVTPIVKGFPGTGGQLYSDNENNIIWIIRGRGLYVLDIPTKLHAHVILGLYGKVITTIVINAEKKIMGATTLSAGAEGFGYHIIDIKKQESTLASGLKNTIYPFYDDYILFPRKLKNEKSEKIKWVLFHYDIANERIVKHNKLTEELTKYQMRFYWNSKVYHLKKRIMLGTNWIGKVGENLVYYTIRWDEEIEKVNIEPLTIQKPENTSLSTDFMFSPDGNWVKSTIKYPNSLIKESELIIYHVSSIYPQHLSVPVYCGYTKLGSRGFMTHDKWGPCYVEHNWNNPDILMVYKLSGALDILKNQMLR